ncbi:MAG TPA: TonB-dependent receptor [Terriglobales bacterium]|nr:TonB-dependent receptor [Terriglobales bacterium]
MKRARFASLFFLLLGLLLLLPLQSFGQAVYGSIFGTVTDPSGAVIPNAKVTVTDVRKGTSDVFTTNESGNYSATHLIPDIYTVKIEAQGFTTAQSDNIQVSADTGAHFDASLKTGAQTETVQVTAEAPQLKTDRSDVAIEFNDRYVEQLPVFNRNFTEFELLSPGTQKLVGWSHASTENPQGSQQIYVNGQHFSGTGYELDGTDNQDPILGIIVINPNLDAITEAKVALQNYDAEFGKAVAGIVTVQTKSGSNDMHGSGFYFRRSDANQARDPFTQFAPDPITGRFLPRSRWQQFGATIGGPIIKDKLFYFGDYQGTRQTSGITNQLTVPTATVLSSCTTGPFCNLSQYASVIGNGTPGDPSNFIYDPATGDPVTGAGRSVFCGSQGSVAPGACSPANANQIPIGRLSPQAINILKLFPSPTGSGIQNNFIASGSGPFNANSFDTRIDYDATASTQVFGRFSVARFNLSGKGSLGALGGVGTGLNGLAGSSITHNYSLASGFTKTFSGTLLTDFRFGWFKYNPTTHKPDEGTTPAKDFGIPNVNMGTVFTSGLPSFEDVGPISSFGDGLNVGRCNCPLVESEQQFQFVNNWTKINGNHQFKFGADIRYAMNLRVPSDADRAGDFHFRSGPTSNAGVGGLGFASFLLGDVQEMNRFVSPTTNAAERQKRWFFYGQDTWRATNKLTVNYGLRWEIYFPESVNGKGNGGFANPVEGIIRIAGYGPYGLNGNIDNSWKAFAPRLGVAYQFTPKTVLRMGYGRSFDIGVFGSNFGHAVTQNLPVLVNQDVLANNNGLAVNNNSFFPAFTLTAGPPVFTFPPIPSNGVLPLGGPAGNVQPRMRPTFQRLPTLDAWNVTLQRQVTNNTSVEVAYVANKGTHGFAGNGPAYDLNPVAFGPGAAIVTTAGTAPSFTPTTPADQRRPYFGKFTYPGFVDPTTGKTLTCCAGGIMGNYFGNDASSNYESFQARVDHRFSHGLQFQADYTYSHANNFSNDLGDIYAVDPRLSYGPDDFNRDHVFIFNAVYDLPFGRGKTFGSDINRAADLIIGGWQLTNTTNWSSGLPWTPSAGECGQVNDTGPCLPNIKGSFSVGAGSFNPITHQVVYFTPVSGLAYPASSLTVGTDTCSLPRPTSGPFSLPACGTDGNVGRNSFFGPRSFFDNMSLAKNFHVTERVNAQFRVDAYNVFNHPVYGFSAQDFGATGGTCIDCGGNNGKIVDIQNGSTMRQLQFGVKLAF